MPWTKPQYTPLEIDDAGKQLALNFSELTSAQSEVLRNFRASHGFPLNTLQMRLRYTAHQVDETAVVNQRLKRWQSITAKLARIEWLRLSKMQDIGGCRAVVKTVEHVNGLVTEFKTGWARHILTKENDYIQTPRKSGYRAHHLIYRYQSDRNSTYNDISIEIQFRSELQHIWAMAVETVGKLLGQPLKSGSGDAQFLRFFALMSSVFAIYERRPTVRDTPSSVDELKLEMRNIDDQVKIINTVQLYTVVASAIDSIGTDATDGLFLIDLDKANRKLDVQSFFQGDYSSAPQQHEVAFEAYQKLEQEYFEDANRDVVLVSAHDVISLKLAYPSYFGDMEKFIAWARVILDT